MKYKIFDEYGELMRTVKRKEEALAIIALRAGWTMQRVIEKRPQHKFEDAPF